MLYNSLFFQSSLLRNSFCKKECNYDYYCYGDLSILVAEELFLQGIFTIACGGSPFCLSILVAEELFLQGKALALLGSGAFQRQLSILVAEELFLQVD